MTEAIRQCGTCHACCVALGIAELRKHAGAVCRHLDGRDPERRCTIYERRPVACSGYRCAWLVGLFGTGDRPNESGVLVTVYKDYVVTIHALDDRAGNGLTHGNATRMVRWLIEHWPDEWPAVDIRIVWPMTKAVLRFNDGLIRHGRLLKPDGPEDLKFEVYDPPVGRYIAREKVS